VCVEERARARARGRAVAVRLSRLTNHKRDEQGFMHKSCDAIGIMNPFTNMKAAAATTVGDISELSLLSAADSHLHKHATQPGDAGDDVACSQTGNLLGLAPSRTTSVLCAADKSTMDEIDSHPDCNASYMLDGPDIHMHSKQSCASLQSKAASAEVAAVVASAVIETDAQLHLPLGGVLNVRLEASSTRRSDKILLEEKGDSSRPDGLGEPADISKSSLPRSRGAHALPRSAQQPGADEPYAAMHAAIHAAVDAAYASHCHSPPRYEDDFDLSAAQLCVAPEHRTVWTFVPMDLSPESASVAARCVALMRACNGTWRVEVLSRATLRQFVGEGDWPDGCTEEAAFSGDFFESEQTLMNWVRLVVLLKHGGVWLDCTAFCTAPIEAWWQQPERLTLFHCMQNPLVYESWAVAAPRGHPLVHAWLDELREAHRSTQPTQPPRGYIRSVFETNPETRQRWGTGRSQTDLPARWCQLALQVAVVKQRQRIGWPALVLMIDVLDPVDGPMHRAHLYPSHQEVKPSTKCCDASEISARSTEVASDLATHALALTAHDRWFVMLSAADCEDIARRLEQRDFVAGSAVEAIGALTPGRAPSPRLIPRQASSQHEAQKDPSRQLLAEPPHSDVNESAASAPPALEKLRRRFTVLPMLMPCQR